MARSGAAATADSAWSWGWPVAHGEGGTSPRPGGNRCPPCQHQKRCGESNGWPDSTVGLLIVLEDGAIPIELEERRRTHAHAIDKSRHGN
jgi:hypothetical protein